MEKSIKFVTSENFRSNFMSQLPHDFQWQKTPVQVYPFEFLSQFLLFPTPILKSDYFYIVFLNKGEYQQQIGSEIFNLEAPL